MLSSIGLFIIKILLLLFILGIIILVHEFGHFIWAKTFGVHIYEFSIGMGKKLFGHKRKGGETEFCVRLVPLGGCMIQRSIIQRNGSWTF